MSKCSTVVVVVVVVVVLGVGGGVIMRTALYFDTLYYDNPMFRKT